MESLDATGHIGIVVFYHFINPDTQDRVHFVSCGRTFRSRFELRILIECISLCVFHIDIHFFGLATPLLATWYLA